MASLPSSYRGRLAPSPTGYLHLGHARTFWTAQQRARAAGGVLVLRNEDLDTARTRADFAAAMLEDLRWFGLAWQEGPDVGGPYAPYNQSHRRDHYLAAFEQLRAAGAIYPCSCSRRDVQEAAGATKTQLEFLPSNAVSFLTHPGDFTALVTRAVAEVTGRTPALSTSGGTSDARFITRDCPVLEFGLVNETIHAVDENSSLADIDLLTAVYRRIIEMYFA